MGIGQKEPSKGALGDLSGAGISYSSFFYGVQDSFFSYGFFVQFLAKKFLRYAKGAAGLRPGEVLFSGAQFEVALGDAQIDLRIADP